MHGKKTFDRIINSKSKRPNRSAYSTNNSGTMIGDWRLEEDSSGNLIATNISTGTSVVLAAK